MLFRFPRDLGWSPELKAEPHIHGKQTGHSDHVLSCLQLQIEDISHSNRRKRCGGPYRDLFLDSNQVTIGSEEHQSISPPWPARHKLVHRVTIQGPGIQLTSARYCQHENDTHDSRTSRSSTQASGMECRAPNDLEQSAARNI